MLKTKFLAALVVGVLTAPMAANAAVVTQLIHFDDATNGWKWYSDKDLNFLFNPTNLSSSAACADSATGIANQDSCVLETNNGTLPKMTRPQFGPQSQGSTNDNPVVSGTDQLFTLNSFYFFFNGEGGKDKDTGLGLNAITVTSNLNTTGFTFDLGGNWDTIGAPDVTFYEGGNAGTLAGNLVKDTGYIATFGNLFQNVSWIQFSAPSTAQLRLDCVVATFEGTTTEPLKPGTVCGIGDGGTGQQELPEPGSLALAGLALLGAYAVRRRKI